MAIADDMEIVKIILPKEYLPKIDKLKAPGMRSRSAIIRRIVEQTLGIGFFIPQCSVDKPESASSNQPEAT